MRTGGSLGAATSRGLTAGFQNEGRPKFNGSTVHGECENLRFGEYFRAMGLSKTSEQSEGPWALQQVLTGHHGAVYDLATDASGALWSSGGDGWLVRWAKQDS